MAKFKAGDTAYIKVVLGKRDSDIKSDYPLININNGHVFTEDGYYRLNDKQPSLLTKDELLKDLNIQSEYPKWMLVTDCEIKPKDSWTKVYVIAKINNYYIATAGKNPIINQNSAFFAWIHAIDIPTFNKQSLLDKADELIAKANELKEQANKL